MDTSIYRLKVWLAVYGISEEKRELIELEQCYYGTLFDHLPHEYWEKTDSAKQRIDERNKKVAFFEPIAKQVIEGIVAHTFGRDKFPELSLSANSDVYMDSEPGESSEFDKEEVNRRLKAFAKAIEKQSFLGTEMIKGARSALLLGWCALTFRIRKGKYFLDAMSRLDIQEIRFDPEDRDKVIYVREVWRESIQDPEDPTNQIEIWRCRVIDEEYEIEFKPIEVDGNPPDFSEAVVQDSVRHQFGFCPVVYCHFTNHLSILYGMVENLKQFSRFSSYIFQGLKNNLNAQFAFMSDDATEIEGMFRSDDNLWLMPNGTLKAVSSTGNYQQAVVWRDKMRDAILKALRVSEIPVDNYQAAEALKMRLAPELNLVEECRTLFGEKALKQLFCLMLKAAIAVHGREVEYEDGTVWIEDMSVNLGKDVQIPVTDDFDVNLIWGEIFTMTAQTRNMEVQTMIMATNNQDGSGEPLLPKTVARDYLSAYVGVEDRDMLDKQIRIENLETMFRNNLNAIIEKAIENGNNDLAMELMAKVVEDSEDDDFDISKYMAIVKSYKEDKPEIGSPPPVIDTFPEEQTTEGTSGSGS